ncbi:hypothetical protein M433DRAFT_150514 [Acidomyces richmondensis BFW]|nr:MAG: hypothetical protein FE78DRAFT_83815 [Acidomyces sp. 'richmondensis']KYG48989.1 hypothetical protein M433DRAFT_150514 [Acidomyces richmondensis BFW]
MRYLRSRAGALALLGITAGQASPYNPTQILLAPNGSFAYIFEPYGPSSGHTPFSALDLRHPINVSQPAFLPVSNPLPFAADGETVPYTAILDPVGSITVLVGNCSHTSTDTQLWRFAADEGNGNGSGTWKQYQVSQKQTENASVSGPMFLGSSMAFSQSSVENDMNTSFFMFGGMCPYSNSSATSWTSSANYSNSMIQAIPADSQTGDVDYSISIAETSGSPIAEAGFSITPLTPSYSVNMTGQAEELQQDFVLLGGHTQTAFINMSQVAIFSLPQESWSFLPVTQLPSSTTDLTTRQSFSEVQPRSGHTAVMTEDGKRVIVFGGWVGDVSNPAEPQLAILDFGSGYGGSGDWSWTIPKQYGPGPSSGTGIYGHGAAMLPGEVMLIVGGYPIPASGSTRIKRGDNASKTQMYLYNITSSTWIESYTSPENFAKRGSDDFGPLGHKSEKVGLGVGLSIGAAILAVLVIYYFWYVRRAKRLREARGRGLLSRSSEGSFPGPFDQNCLNHGGIDGRGGDTAAAGRFWNVWDRETGTYPQRTLPMTQTSGAGSTGLFVNIPSPTRGLRKSVPVRNYQYHAAPRYDEKRMSRGSGYIHPIVEREDEDAQSLTRKGSSSDELTDAERKLKEVEQVLNSDDPFIANRPNPLGSHPVLPELDRVTMGTICRSPNIATRISTQPPGKTASSRPEIPNWMIEREDSDRPLIDTGRVSPSKTGERTSSTLSEKSQRSNVSGHSIARTLSTGTGAILAVAMAARTHPYGSPEQTSSSAARTQPMSANGSGQKPSYFKASCVHSSKNGPVLMNAPNSAGTDADSFTTAETTFAELRNQGEALLGDRPIFEPEHPCQRAVTVQSYSQNSLLPSNSDIVSAGGMPYRRRQSLMGSLRRALNVVSISDHSWSFTGSYERDVERYTDDPQSAASSPTKGRNVGNGPRRAISDGSALLRQMRGQKDWSTGQWPRYRDDPDPGDWGEPGRTSVEAQEAEEDWDVEAAAEKRDVQMMFTVPKAKLRVVNADIDQASLRSASDSALSRAGSVRTVKQESSTNALRARADTQTGVLPSTAEESEPGGGECYRTEKRVEGGDKEKVV